MERQKASQENYGSSIPYKLICTKRTVPSIHSDKEDEPVHGSSTCLLPRCAVAGPLRNEMVSILTAIPLVARLSRKNIEDMSLLIYLELKIWNQWAMEEQMCVYTCICV